PSPPEGRTPTPGYTRQPNALGFSGYHSPVSGEPASACGIGKPLLDCGKGNTHGLAATNPPGSGRDRGSGSPRTAPGFFARPATPPLPDTPTPDQGLDSRRGRQLAGYGLRRRTAAGTPGPGSGPSTAAARPECQARTGAGPAGLPRNPERDPRGEGRGGAA